MAQSGTPTQGTQSAMLVILPYWVPPLRSKFWGRIQFFNVLKVPRSCNLWKEIEGGREEAALKKNLENEGYKFTALLPHYKQHSQESP